MQYRRKATGSEPVSLEQARLNLRIPEIAEADDELVGMISAAREYAEAFTGMTFADQTVIAYPDTLEAMTRLPFAPISEIKRVVIYGADGSTNVIEPEAYIATNDGIGFLAVPDIEASPIMPYEIEYVSEAGDVPFTVVQAILQLTNHFYDNRSAVTEGSAATTVPYTVERLLRAHKRWWH